MQCLQAIGGDGDAMHRPCHGQAVGNVGPGLHLIERAQLPVQGNATLDLTQAVLVQRVEQLGLAAQHHLNQLALGRLEVAELAHHVEGQRVQRLCVVDKQYIDFPLGRLGQQKFIECRQVVNAPRTGWQPQAKVGAHSFE